MFIFDHPYISDVANDFLVESQQPLLSNDFTRNFVGSNANTVTDEKALKILEQQDYRWLYSNSENAISWITEKLGAESPLARNIELFKNKFLFREATSHLFPEVTFMKIPARELAYLTFEQVGKPFIIKPVVGFISAGVYRVDNDTEWQQIKEKILQDTESVATSFPEEVLNSNYFIVESIIEGEEYAIDAYFDDNNEPVILNILHHRFSGEHDMSDRLYVTSAEIIREQLEPMGNFLARIGQIGDFRGMPIHAEVRIDKQGNIVPIEINPLRFAGWCSTDIAYYAYDINVYDYFATRKKPNWDTLLEGKSSQFAMGLIECGKPVTDNQHFDYDKLEQQFSSVLALRKIDYRNFPLYAFLFVEIEQGQSEELDIIMKMEPDDFLVD